MPSPISAQQSKNGPGRPVQIAVIGGGPKAAAIAAKAWILHEHEQGSIYVTIFEPEKIGAYWSGQAGYTDGEQRLCTPAERDVGYPYNSMFGNVVDVAMSTKFSWMRFLHTPPDGYETGYSTWVDAGRKPPAHKHYASYLQWVVLEASSQVSVVKQTVIGLAKDRKRWRLEIKDAAGNVAVHPTQFDAAVVTGPGPAKRVPVTGMGHVSANPGNIFNGRDFWQRLNAVRKCIRQARKDRDFSGNAIVIIGAGGTAAAILAWLVSNGASDLPIQMVASQAALYTRVDSVFENQLFSDETLWATLSPTSRRAFFDRLNRGVVWSTVMDRVSAASNFKMVDGRAQNIVIASATELQLEVVRGDGVAVTLPSSMLIDCSGFEPWWFLSMIKGFPQVSAGAEKKRRDKWQENMNENLSLEGVPWRAYPALHAPMLSSELGPGFGSLMVLGAMADRVLRRYCP